MRISDWSSDVCSSDITFQLTEPKPMNATRILARWICTIAFLAVGVATLQGLAIVVFIICGTLVPGERMFGDSATPSLAGAIIDRKSTRLTPVTNAHLVCRLLLEQKNNTIN